LSEQTSAADFIKNQAESIKTIEKLEQSNAAKLQSLAQEGVQFGPGVHALWKTDALIETIMTSEEAKLISRHNLEKVKQKFLNDILKEIRQMRLTEGVVPQTSKLTIPGR
jgi:hypothetical protein